MSIQITPHDGKRELTTPARPPHKRWQRVLVRYTGASLAASAFFLLAVAFVLQETEERGLTLGNATLPLLAAAHSLGLLVFLRTLEGWGWWKAAAVALGAGALALATTYVLELVLPALLSAGFSFGFGDNDDDNQGGRDNSNAPGHTSGWLGSGGGIEGGSSGGESAAGRGTHQQCPGCGRPTASGLCPSCRW